MTENQPITAGGLSVRPFISFGAKGPELDYVDVSIVVFDYLGKDVDRVVLCLVRNQRTREVTTRVARSVTEACRIMETWLGGPVPL